MLRMVDSRSLHCATPDFLSNLVALPYFMRLSLRKGAHAASSSAAWQEIRVRSGRDDTSVWNGQKNSREFFIALGGLQAHRRFGLRKPHASSGEPLFEALLMVCEQSDSFSEGHILLRHFRP